MLNNVKAILCHPKLQFISHLIFIFMNIDKIDNIFRHAESIRQYTCKNVHIIDRPIELKLVLNDCLDIVL